MWEVRTEKIIKAIYNLPTPMNLSVIWNLGRMLGLLLGIQIITGLFLSIHYTADVQLAFTSVALLVRDVNRG